MRSMLCVSFFWLVFSPVYFIKGSVFNPVEYSHSIMGHLQLIQVMEQSRIPKDVTNIILRLSWQLRQEECDQWQGQLKTLNSFLMPFDSLGNITIVDVMSLTKEQKKSFASINGSPWPVDSKTQEIKVNENIFVLPLYLQKKLIKNLPDQKKLSKQNTSDNENCICM